MGSNYSLSQWLEDGATAELLNENFSCWGFYDWFCSDKGLENRSKKLVSKLKKVLKANQIGKKFDLNNTYTFFINNCPCVGKLYDDFRICDMKTGDVLYTIIPASGFNSEFGRSEVWGKDNDFHGSLCEGTWEDVLKYFMDA